MKRILFLLIVSSLVVCEGIAQSSTTGSIEGTVTDEVTGEPLAGANVILLNTTKGSATSLIGTYFLGNLSPGKYDIRFSILGYRTVVVQGVRVIAGLKTTVNASLTQTAVALDPMMVMAERPPIQKDVTGSVHTIGAESFETLPVTTLADVIGLTPGVTLENNIRGGKTTEVVYLLDGLPIQNFIEGGLAIDLPQSSIADLTVQTGGFDPEYGNALSGVINIVTKRGSDRHTVSLRAEKDDLFGGKQVDKRNEVDLEANGPLAPDFSYVASLTALHTDTRWWQDLSQFFSSPIVRAYSGFAKTEYQAGSGIRLGLQLLASYKEYHDYEFSWRFHLNGLPPRQDDGYRIAAMINHSISPSFFYIASVSRFTVNSAIGNGSREHTDTTIYQWDFFLRYIIDGNRSWWARRKQVHNLTKVDFTWRLNQNHLIKFGGDMNMQEIYSDILRYEPQVNPYGKPFVDKPMLNYSTDFEYFPRMGSAYLQDKIELSRDGMELNLGVRYDFLDPRAERPLAERVPTGGNQYETYITGSVPASIKQLWSPRIGFAAPYAENGYLFINYGIYYQFPLFDYLYSGLNNVSLRKGSGILIGNPDLRPEQTRAWEMSLKYAVSKELVLSATYFHKETLNQIDVKTFVPTNSSVAGDYGFAEYVNNPYSRSSGIELSVSSERSSHVSGSISYTYMTAEGLSESPVGGLQYYQWGIEVPSRMYPLSWDQRHTVKVIAMADFPLGVKMSLSWLFHSGRPYTYYPSKDGFTPEDPTQEFEPNNARMKDYNLVNMKLMRLFKISTKPLFYMTVYVDVRNLLNTKNVRWVDSAGRIGGELEDLTAYDPSRRTRLGLRVEL